MQNRTNVIGERKEEEKRGGRNVTCILIAVIIE
jgi:hypothetical protein